MALSRYSNRRDVNEPEIVKALRAIGCTVKHGNDIDLIVGYQNRNYLLEVKTAKGKLKPSQEELLRVWRGQYAIVRTVQEAIDVVTEKV